LQNYTISNLNDIASHRCFHSSKRSSQVVQQWRAHEHIKLIKKSPFHLLSSKISTHKPYCLYFPSFYWNSFNCSVFTQNKTSDQDQNQVWMRARNIQKCLSLVRFFKWLKTKTLSAVHLKKTFAIISDWSFISISHKIHIFWTKTWSKIL
jgi:hypothetical protein